MKKKLIIVFLMVMFFMFLGDVTALEISNEEELRSCVNSDSVCTLNSDIEVNGTINIKNDVQINLNGYSINHKYKPTERFLFSVSKKLNITNDKTTGGIKTNGNMILLWNKADLKLKGINAFIFNNDDVVVGASASFIENGTNGNGNIEIYDSTLDSSDRENHGHDDIKVSTGTLYINGLKVKSNGGILYGENKGYNENAAPNIIIDDAEFITKSMAIDIRSGNIEINKINLKSDYIVCMDISGNSIINDGTFNKRVDISITDINGKTIINGGNFTDGIMMDANDYEKLYGYTLEVNGGDFNSKVAIHNGNLKVNGGTFKDGIVFLGPNATHIYNGQFLSEEDCGLIVTDLSNQKVKLEGGAFSTNNDELGGICVISNPNHSTKVTDILAEGFILNPTDIYLKSTNLGDGKLFYSITNKKVNIIKNDNHNENNYATNDVVKNPKTNDINVLLVGIGILSVGFGLILGIKKLKKLSK